MAYDQKLAGKIIDDQAARIETLEDALHRIVQWSMAYPTDIFHEPSAEECQRAHRLLVANGMTLDAFSASMGRHCLRGVGEIARGALAAVHEQKASDSQ